MNCAYLVICSLNDLRDLWILHMCDYMDCIYLVIDSLNDLWDLRILHRSIQYSVVHYGTVFFLWPKIVWYRLDILSGTKAFFWYRVNDPVRKIEIFCLSCLVPVGEPILILFFNRY